MDTEYLKVGEVAKRLHVSRQAVYNWISDGRLKAVKLGASVRVPVSALLEFMKPVEPGEQVRDPEDESLGQLTGALATA